jgi:MFS family permease
MTVGYTDNFKANRTGTLLQMAFGSIGIIWQSQRLRLLFPALFLLQAGWMLAFTYVPLVAQEVYTGNDPGTATGIVVGAGGFIALILSPILGSVGDRFGYWRVLFIASMLSVALWPLPWFTRDLVSFGVAWAIINGLSSAIFAISFTVLANSTTSDVRGRVMTFSYLPVNMGFAAGPAVGLLVTRVSLFAVFPAAAVITLLGIGALYAASRQPISAGSVEMARAA